MQMKAFVGRPLAEHPQLGGCISGRGGFNSVDVGSYNREEKVERRHRRDGDKARKERRERRKRKERTEKREKEKERKLTGGRREMGKESKRDYFYNYCGLARIKGN